MGGCVITVIEDLYRAIMTAEASLPPGYVSEPLGGQPRTIRHCHDCGETYVADPDEPPIELHGCRLGRERIQPRRGQHDTD